MDGEATAGHGVFRPARADDFSPAGLQAKTCAFYVDLPHGTSDVQHAALFAVMGG